MGCSNSSEGGSDAPALSAPAPPSQYLRSVPPFEVESREIQANRKVEWERVRQLLPVARTPEEFKRRKELFSQFDPNGNGKLSLAEIDKGCREILHLDDFTRNLAPILIRAYNSAKCLHRKPNDDEYVEFIEFRMLLAYIYDYFELMVMFEEMDTSNDRRLSLQEFKHAVPKLEQWGLAVPYPEVTFCEMDANHGGMVLFEEFCNFATKKKLNADGHSEPWA